jgi:hypothetical protein
MSRQVQVFVILLTCFTGIRNATNISQGARPTDNREEDSCTAYATKPMPSYRIAKRFVKQNPVYIHLYVSLPPSEITRSMLVTLVCKLANENAQADSLSIQIFDNYRIASEFHASNEGDPAGSERHRRGLYTFSRESGEAYGQRLAWLPKKGVEWRHIYLGPPPEPVGN